MKTQHKWLFKPRLRARAFGWSGSNLACQRLKEAASEIRKVAKTDLVTAGDGVVALMERFWPAFQEIDTSSGALGGMVGRVQEELLPILIAARPDQKIRNAWLERLWQAIEDDGVDYLSVTADRWGELCASTQVASDWADRFLDPLRSAWSGPQHRGYFRATSVCLSSLLAAGRHKELLDLLALERLPFWHDRKFGARALLAQGQWEEALAYAEGSRGLNQPDSAIDAACEQILLDHGREDEAYGKYALSANQSSTGLATFRIISKKYPDRDPRQILLDLAAWSHDPGRWFAAAKTARYFDLALEFARTGRTDPRTLSRASRDMLDKDARFSLETGRLAIRRIVAGHGYDLTGLDLMEARRHFMAAAHVLGITTEARAELLAIAAEYPGAFSELLIRYSSESTDTR